MKKKIIAISLAVLGIAGVALANGTGFVYTPFVNYTEIQSIAQTGSSFPINVYKVQDADANCYVSVVGSGAASISCVPVVKK